MEVLSSRVLYRSSQFDALRRLYEQIVGLHVYRAEEDRLRAAGVAVVKPVERMPWGPIEGWVHDQQGNEVHLVEVPDDHPIQRRY
jgi:uncharacterized glyoxalase superfamily protein PhnB